MYKDKEKEAEYQKVWRLKNKEKIAKRNKEYRAKHREKLLAYQKEHYRNNKEMYRKSAAMWRKCNVKQYKKSLASWETIIPSRTTCGVCGKIIYFNRGNPRNAIHFDHRHGGKEAIKGSPARFLRDRKRTPEAEKIWLSCDFGMLCEKCNRSLPTENRIDFLIKALKYARQNEDGNPSRDNMERSL